MPRRPRVDLPGTIHHVCIRGVEGRPIFVDEDDPADLLQRFERWVRETRSQCLARSFNGNHAHFVIARGEEPLAKLMARFTSAFAQRFNWRHGRRGHLFMGRYESRWVRDEHDLRWLVLYAAANPVRHAACAAAALDRYPGSSWGGMIGGRPWFAFESLDLPLSLYGDSARVARRNLREALRLAARSQWAPPPDPRLSRLVAAACAARGIAAWQFSGSSRAARAVQNEVLGRAIRELGITWREAARQLPVSRSRIARLARLAPSPNASERPRTLSSQ